jgi:hypothetical protein
MLLVPGEQAFRYLLSISLSPGSTQDAYTDRWRIVCLEDKKSEPKICVADERAGEGG